MNPNDLAMMEELLNKLGTVLDSWYENPRNTQEEKAKIAVVMTTLTNALVASAVAYQVPIEVLMYNIANTLSTHGMLDDDDHPVH